MIFLAPRAIPFKITILVKDQSEIIGYVIIEVVDSEKSDKVKDINFQIGERPNPENNKIGIEGFNKVTGNKNGELGTLKRK